ncbi:MAG: tetratricopeptide repeat protein [Planctomycetota bacterium]|jgi:tetratricopeptide (TPR) repeat protein
MHSDSTENRYEQALTMAEAGQHEQALEQIINHLQTVPSDGKAFNDAGTLLFCLRRGREAITFFEKALQFCQGDDRTQVYWNLCEAYLQEGYPEKAVELFAVMHQNEILNIDTVNRTANVFLQKNQLGRAIEVLKCSLKLAPGQQVLGPMMEAIRGNRQTALVISDSDSFITQSLGASLDSLMPTRRWVGDQCDMSSEAVQGDGFSIFVGIGNTLLACLQRGGPGKKILILNEQDLSSPFLGQVDFSKIDAVVACTDAEWVEYLRQQAPLLTVIRADTVPDPETLPLYDKKQGKRIAAVGPWSARTNPMFLLQCFQKLHYLDADTRLYLAGGFEDPTLERYMNRMIEAMELDNVVFLDGPVRNLSRWLKDKHYIVSTAIDASALGGVWAGAACGLMPLVHRFAAVDEMFDSEFVFDLAEDFFRLIHNGRYDPKRYRRLAQERFNQNGLAAAVHTLLCEMESQMAKQIPSMGADPAAAPLETTGPSSRSVGIPVKQTDPCQCMMQEQGLPIEAMDPSGSPSFCRTN